VRVTHPFHPRFGQELEFVKRLMTWRVDRVFFFDEAGALGSLPAEWTDLAPPDVFVVVADGRVPFRTSALLELADRLAVLRAKGSAPSGEGVQDDYAMSVKEIMSSWCHATTKLFLAWRINVLLLPYVSGSGEASGSEQIRRLM
jgi:Family of unknown function (DUF5372)